MFEEKYIYIVVNEIPSAILKPCMHFDHTCFLSNLKQVSFSNPKTYTYYVFCKILNLYLTLEIEDIKCNGFNKDLDHNWFCRKNYILIYEVRQTFGCIL